MDLKHQTQDNRHEKLKEALDAKAMIEGELFQKFFAKRIKKEKEKLKFAYECDSIAELKYLKGKVSGLDIFLKVCKELDTEIRYLKNELGN